MATRPHSETERWRQVPGHPDHAASSFGRVRSLDRFITYKNGRTRFLPGRILRPHLVNGYHQVNLGDFTTFFHVLVCLAFHGPRPTDRHQVAHKNGNRADNRSGNLRWMTPLENSAERVRHGTLVYGVRHHNSRLTEESVREIRKLLATGYYRGQIAAIAKQFDIPRQTITLIRKGVAWKQVADGANNEPEEWRTIPGYPGYQASSLGRMRSVDRWITKSNGHRGFWFGSMQRPTLRGRYYRVSVGGETSVAVHTLVCTAFHGERPSKGQHTAHWNGDCLDNRPENLRWATPGENKADQIRHGRHAKGETNGCSKLTEADVVAIRKKRVTTTLSLREIGAMFGIGQSQTKRIVDGASWCHVS